MQLPDAIDPDQLRVIAVIAIVVLALLALLVVRFIQKLILKLVLVVVLAAGGVFLYAQRDALDDCQQRLRAAAGRECTCGFAGFDVRVPGCVEVRTPGT